MTRGPGLLLQCGLMNGIVIPGQVTCRNFKNISQHKHLTRKGGDRSKRDACT